MACVALTVWEDRISPVFDVAHDLMIVTIDSGMIENTRYVSFDPERMTSLMTIFQDRNVECLICGAISEAPARMIMDSGIRLIPFITGDLDQVLSYYVKGEPIVPGFLMPGCGCPRRGSCGRHRRGRDRGDTDSNEKGSGLKHGTAPSMRTERRRICRDTTKQDRKERDR